MFFLGTNCTISNDIQSHTHTHQWRIQDFPDFAKFSQNCMKLKEFGLPGDARPSRHPLDPPHTHTHTHTESPNVDTVQIHGSCSAQVADGNFCQLCIFLRFSCRRSLCCHYIKYLNIWVVDIKPLYIVNESH